MDVTSEEIRSSRFQGTRHVYDRREVDAFLHRAASTLEIYERKLTVTESHVENLEKALELAQSRARSMGGLDGRIAELEAALAASQHNYESAMSELEARAEFDSNKTSLAKSARDLQVKTEAVDALKTEAARTAQVIENEASATADSTVSAARTEAEEILRTALVAQTSIIEEVEQMRLAAEAQVGAKLEELRGTADAPDGELSAASLLELKEKAAKAKTALKKANKRATAAEARAQDAETQLDLARHQIAAQSGEGNAVVAAGVAGNDGSEVDDLRRQVAQMRTALSNIQERFSSAAKLSPEELELAAELVDLDLHDVDMLVDLTTPAMTQASDTAVEEVADPDTGDEEAAPKVAIKAKWAQSGGVPAGALTEGRADLEATRRAWPETDQPAPNWRDTFGSGRKRAVAKAAAEQKEEPLGFYERRLAGLRDRIREAGGGTED